MNRCFSEMFNPILLENGGTRWDYRTDFYHRYFKQKKRNGKFRWKKNKWEWWHEDQSNYAPYYALLPEKNSSSSFSRYYLKYLDCGLYEYIDHYYCYTKTIRLISEIDRFGNIKCKCKIHYYSDKDIHSQCIKFIDNKLSKYFDTSLIYKNADTNELLSFIFNNFVNVD